MANEVEAIVKNRLIDKMVLPGESEYYRTSVDTVYLDKLHANISKKQTDGFLKAVFYKDNLPQEKLGRLSQYNAYLIKAKAYYSPEDIEYGRTDANSVCFSLDSIYAGEETEQVTSEISGIVEQNSNSVLSSFNGNKQFTNTFSVRLLGIDANPMPNWGKDVFNKSAMPPTQKMTVKQLRLQNSSYVWINDVTLPEDKVVNLIKIGDKWCQYEVLNETGDTITVKWLVTNTGDKYNFKNARRAAQLAGELLAQTNGECYILLDRTALNKNINKFPTRFNSDYASSDFINTAKLLIEGLLDDNYYRNTGFNAIGLDSYKRFLGAVYVKINNDYINLAKYVIANMPETQAEELPQNISEVFKPWTYDYKNREYADAFWETAKEFDTRKKVQEEIFKTNFKDLTEWTVMIGDTMFFIPPTSIRCITQTTATRMPLVRSKGSATKSSEKSYRAIELTLYFNDNAGINGYPYETKLPNGQKVTYWINGLRALISQFKLTPFLPIENKYINETLNIDAVSLRDISISTVEGFPTLLAVNLVVEEFNYHIYMPEIAALQPEGSEYRNYFAATINFDTMRWFYQQPIIRGEKISEYAFNSPEFNTYLRENKTCLRPLAFGDNKIDFYVASEDYLKILQQVKQNALTNPAKQITLSSEEKRAAKDLAALYNAINSAIKTPEFVAAISEFKADKISLDTALGRLVEQIKKNYVGNIETETYSIDGIDDGAISIKAHLPYITDDQMLTGLKQMATLSLNTTANNFFNDKTVVLNFTNISENPFALDQDNYDLHFLAFCADLASRIETNNDVVDQAYATIDYTKLDNELVFNKYEIGEVIVNSITANMGNTISKTTLNGVDGYAQQYMGGQETVIDVSMIAAGPNAEYTVARLNELPRLAAYYAREYRHVLPCSPLRVDNGITGLLGVAEVVIENVAVSTIPNMPNTYSISMRLISVDRTVRTKEALKKIEANNAGKNIGKDKIKLEVKTYFDLQKELEQVELYPDLELPTIEELEKCGLYFLRYKNTTNQKYVDPDFYFVYSQVLTSELLRESILNSLKESVPTKFVDASGATVTTDENGSIAECNEAFQKQKELIERLGYAAANIYSRKYAIDELEAISRMQDRWLVADNIAANFMDKKTSERLAAAPNNEFAASILQRNQRAIDYIDALLRKPISANYGESEVTLEAIKNILTRADIKKILKELYISVDNSETTSLMAKIIYSAACAASARYEYGTDKDTDWKPQNNFAIVIDTQSHDGAQKYDTNIDNAIKNGIAFGAFGIKMYTAEELAKITGETIDDIKNANNGINGRYFLLDPYYRAASQKEIEEYKNKCITSGEYCTEAYVRLMLYWFKQMLKNNLLPSVIGDIAREKAFEEANIAKKVHEAAKVGLNASSYSAISWYVEDGMAKAALMQDGGKIFAAAVLASTANKDIWQMLLNCNYDALNAIIMTSSSYVAGSRTKDENIEFIRKMLRALIGTKAIVSHEKIQPIDAKATKLMTETIEKLYIEAANDIQSVILHSFYDMITNDYRGRMLRVFPTFYVLFVDDGRQIGVWKLHDNFYNYNAIAEMEITKSRSIPADTARIVMSNFYNTLAKDNDIQPDIEAAEDTGFREIWDNLWSPRKVFLREEYLRQKQSTTGQPRLTSGTRIHVRLGYGSNAWRLPIVFNGVIAEIVSGEMVELIAQGDGIELLNPIVEDDEAHDLVVKDNLISAQIANGATPKTIMDKLLTIYGGFMRDKVYNLGVFLESSVLTSFSRNPYGIFHFGDPDFKDIFESGEPTQNIYEALAQPVLTDNEIKKEYSSDTPPKITFDLFGKTAWDVFNICRSVSPDFILGIAPFGLRSTIFHGHPRYYYAYEYINDASGAILERRKPYQQYHIYTSYSDIVSNNIYASEMDIKTCAIGVYTRHECFGTTSQQRVGPLWVDINIFPEKQKTMVVDTKLRCRSMPFIGQLPFVSTIIDNVASEKGPMPVDAPYWIAWRSTASALKESIKDMYQGEMLVIGDPTVKPHDRIIINDSYEHMTGQCLVKEVVHMFSCEDGFITSISPDCIAVVDDDFELKLQQRIGSVCAHGLLASALVAGGALTNKVIQRIGENAAKTNMVGKASDNIKTIIKNSKETLEELAKNSKAIKYILDNKEVFAKLKGVLQNTLPAKTAIGIATAIETVGVTMLANWISESIYRFMKNRRVLTVYPLKRFGVVMTAGLSGSKGVVYGSPSFKDSGIVEKVFASITAKTGNTIIDTLKELLMPSFMELGNKYAHIEEGHANTQEANLNAILANYGRSSNAAGYKQYLLMPKATTKEELKQAHEALSIKSVDKLEFNNTLLNQMKYVGNSAIIKRYIDNGFFKILSEHSTINSNKFETKDITFDLGGKQVTVKAIYEHQDNGTTICILPFLRHEAIEVLEAIVERAHQKCKKDQAGAYDTVLVLNSALRAGDINSFASTGLSFVLQAVGDDASILIKAIEEEIEGIETIAKVCEAEGIKTMLKTFMYSIEKGNTALITVLPPKTSAIKPSNGGVSQ